MKVEVVVVPVPASIGPKSLTHTLRSQSERSVCLVERGVDWQTVGKATPEDASHDIVLHREGR
jgi:hypothetical protein